MAIALTVTLAVAVGLSLGLLGGGGSILAVPLLVYVAGLDAQTAVATSLFVVGVTSAVAVVPHAGAGRVRWRTGLLFAGGGMVGAYLGGRLATHVPGPVLLVAFATMMLATAAAMIRGRTTRPTPPRVGDAPSTLRRRGRVTDSRRAVGVVALGVAVGTLTGFVGAGGGFLIVPALTLVAGLPMAQAVGTSLLVISLQSAAGLAGHLHGTTVPWSLALAVTTAAVLGSLVGARLASSVPQPTLRRAFGVMVLVMGAVVLAQQLPQVIHPTTPSAATPSATFPSAIQQLTR